MERKLGKVYVAEKITDSDGKETTNLKLLDSVNFCNIDHKLYSPDGTLSPLYELYCGRPYTIQFHMNLNDQNGKPVDFEGRVKMVYKLGQVPTLDIENIPAGNKKMMEWLKSVETVSSDVENDDGYRIVEELNGASVVCFLAPGTKICDMWSFHLHMDPIWIMDDYLDRKASCNSTSYKTLTKYWSLVCELLEGKRSQEEVETIIREYNLADQYLKWVRQVGELRRHLAQNETAALPLIEQLTKWYEGANLENCREWKRKEQNPTSKMYRPVETELHLLRGGAAFTVELVLFDRGIFVPPEIRKSFIFEMFIRAWVYHARWINDIISLKKELREGTTSNFVFLSHVHEGLELHDALRKAVDELNRWTDITIEAGELILEMYGEFEEAQKLVDVVYGLTHGDAHWYGVTKRYHKNMVFDCVIELE